MALKLKRTAKGSADEKEGAVAKAVKKPAKLRKQQFMLFVGDDGAILVYMEGATVVRRLFAPTATPEHTRTMIELMGQHPQAPVSLLFDVIDQQYVRQTFPPVSPLSVEGLVRRRLERDFAAEDLRGSLRLGREDTPRKDWMYLLIALANTANFQQWVELVVEQPNRLLGAFLIPVECQNFIPLLASVMPNRPQMAPEWQLLISHHKVSGFRIVVLRNGKLAFTRVSQAVGEAVSAVLAGNVEQEIQNTIEYIRRLGYAETSGLEIFAILASEVRDSIDTKRVNAAAIHLLSPLDVADALELHQAALAADRFGDVVMASSFVLSRKPILRLYPAYAQKLDQLYKARLGTKIAAGLIGLLLLGLAAGNAMDAMSAYSEISKAKASLAQDTPTLDLLRKQVEGLGEAVNLKNDIAAFYEKIKPNENTPLMGLDSIVALKRSNVVVDEWDWATLSNLPNADGNMPQPPAVTAAADGTMPPSGPVTMHAKASLLGTFLDNESIIAAVSEYKKYLEKAVTDYTVSIDNPEFAAQGGGKISVALNTEPAPSSATGGGAAAAQSPVLSMLLVGPKPKDAAAAPADGSAPPAPPMPGGQP